MNGDRDRGRGGRDGWGTKDIIDRATKMAKDIHRDAQDILRDAQDVAKDARELVEYLQEVDRRVDYSIKEDRDAAKAAEFAAHEAREAGAALQTGRRRDGDRDDWGRDGDRDRDDRGRRGRGDDWRRS